MTKKEELFQSLYTRYRPGVIAHLVRFGFSRDYAQDLAQDVFLRVYEGIEGWRQEAEWSFLRTTTQRIALNAIRSGAAAKRSGHEVPIDGPRPLDLASRDAPVVEQLIETEVSQREVQRLKEGLAALPRRLSGPLLLRLEGYSYREIATHLHLTLDAVKTRIKEAKSKLRELVGSAPEDPDDDEET